MKKTVLVASFSLSMLTGCDALIEQVLTQGMAQQARTREALMQRDKITVVTCGTNSPMTTSASAQSCTGVFTGAGGS